MAVSSTPSTPSLSTNSTRIDYTTLLPHSTKLVILGAVLLSLFLAALDQTIVATALPAIVRNFHGIDLVSWVSTAYLLASTAMIPIYGKLSDMYGRKPVLLVGIIVFLLGSALCGLAGSMIQLIIFRVVQGLGAAAITSTAFATPADLFVPADRPKYMGFFGAIFGLASVVGPFIGGVLTDQMSWRWVFYVNLPLGLIAMVFIIMKMPQLASGVRARIDWLGTLLLIGAVVPLMLGLTLDKSVHGWLSPQILGLFALGLVCTVLLILVELRVSSPVISLDLFLNRTFTVGVIASILNGASMFGAVLFLSLFLVNVLGLTATEAGIVQMPLMIGFVISSNISSFIVQRTGRYKPFIVVGFVLMCLGFASMAWISETSSVYSVAVRVFLVGFGLGPAMPLLNLAMQNAARMDQIGAVTANRQFFQQLGQAMGGAVFGVVLTIALTGQLQTRFAPLSQQLPLAAQGVLDPDRFRNSVSEEGGSDQNVDLGAQIAEAVRVSIEQQRALAQAAFGTGDAAAREQLANTPGTLPELQALLENSPVADAQTLDQANRLIDTAEQDATRVAEQIGPQVNVAVKLSYAVSITRIYIYAFWLSLIALVAVTVWLPEIPLSKGRHIETTVFE